jgi:hypothetical protein
MTGFQIFRNEIQAGRNKFQIRRNEIQIQNLGFPSPNRALSMSYADPHGRCNSQPPPRPEALLQSKSLEGRSRAREWALLDHPSTRHASHRGSG